MNASESDHGLQGSVNAETLDVEMAFPTRGTICFMIQADAGTS
jgi:hypothetical protein